MSKLTYVNLADLELPEFQAHRQISDDYIHEISDSIRVIGVIEPLIIRDTDHGKEIVCGCVRYHAARLAGLKAVPCINMSLDPKAAEVIKLHENIKRIPLDHIDQGATFIMMMEKFHMTEKSISEVVGKSIAYISQHISLVRLDNELTKAVKDKKISFSQARELMRVDDESERLRLLSYCQEEGATVSVLQRWIQDYFRNKSVSSPQDSSAPEQTYHYSDQHNHRLCEACDKSVEIGKIRQVFYCPACHKAIKDAISDEKRKIN
ncbi:MAG: ParB/RepB/Spo0J family partition protein [Candidatus Helarchaeota archaeon]|nr:ParB/RepB/Spo0J family partition protein [Candidatus Helarchaeota archaeon]